MAWIFVIIFAYLFFALSALGDKLVLKGPTQPISYTFFSGALNALALFLIPFAGLIPNLAMAWWLAADAVIFLLGLYFGFLAVDKFEVSRASATIGATQPIFIFFISWMFFGYQAMSLANFFAFLLLFAGSVFISFDKKPRLTGQFLKLTVFSAIMYSLDYVLIKYIYAGMGFIPGFAWRSVFIFIFALSLLIITKNRKEIFKQKEKSTPKLRKTFFATQACGGLANIFQSYAIYLAPVAVLPIMNSMRGMQYAFLLIIVSIVSCFLPKLLKENISRKVMAQKIVAIILIIIGLIILAY